jgi:hypothetical protein
MEENPPGRIVEVRYPLLPPLDALIEIHPDQTKAHFRLFE